MGDRQLTVLRIAAATAVGILTGVVVLALEHWVDDLLKEIFDGPAWLPAVTVVGGALATAVLVQFAAGRSSATTEAFIDDFHRDEPTLEPRHAPGRLAAAFTTLGSGAPLGMEGPAVYAGSAIADIFRRRIPLLGLGSHNTLLIAGAAAGVAAVFKAPAAGAIFALEAPYKGRLAGERVLPALFGSAGGFMTMAVIDGFEPEQPLPAVDLTYGRAVGAIVLGAIVGVAALGVIWLVHQAEHVVERGSPWLRALLAGGVLAGLYWVGRELTDEPIALASGNNVIDWVLDPAHGVGLLLAVFVIRAIGPSVSIAGGGVGGLFIPLMAAGAVIGRLFADATNTEDLTLYVMVGASTMLGAGYAVPLTGVVFVAEYTGQASIAIPAFLAMTTVKLVVGSRSVSPGQID